MTPPPIPEWLAHRPVVAGLAVPYITVEHQGRYAFGAVHEARAAQCVTRALCQVCARPLTDRAVLLVRDRDLTLGQSPEPAMDPVCAAYSIAACPMLAGQMTHYRATPPALPAHCHDPACDCGGWVALPDPGATTRAGHPAETWWTVWLGPDQYRGAVTDTGVVTGVVIPPDPLKVRPVTAGRRP